MDNLFWSTQHQPETDYGCSCSYEGQWRSHAFPKNQLGTGVAASQLQNKRFYPTVCSTAAKSSMKVIRSCASHTSLQYLCCYRLRQLLPDYVDTLEVLPLPPGLKQVLQNKLGWVLNKNCGSASPSSGSDSDSSCSSEGEVCRRKRCRRTW